MRWRWLAALAATLPALLGVDLPELTDKEQATLARGEPISRWDPGAHEVLGVVDVAAHPEVVMDAILDLAARREDQKAIKSVEIYARSADPERLSARWSVSLLTMRSVFHIVYEVDRTAGTCTYWLDDAQDNDIIASRGSYSVLSHGAGSRIVYASHSETGGSTPSWVRRWFAVDSLEAQLGGIKRRSENNS